MKINLYSPYTRIALRVLPVLVAIALLVILRWAEYTFMPVVRDFHLTKLERTGNYIIMQGYLRKVRNCKYVGISVEGIADSGRVDLPLKFLDSEKLNDNGTRPEGTQDWGPWRIVIPGVPSISAVDLHSVHSCHLAWETTTNLATVPLVAAQKGNE